MVNRYKILITGRTGYISNALRQSLSQNHDITCIGRSDLLLTNKREVDSWFKGKKFDIVIHTAINGGHRLKAEEDNILSDNIKMFFNLLYHKDKYKKFISFGSFAENNLYGGLYGLSKNIISQYIEKEDTFYNLKICGVFDHNEKITRFIKANTLKYIAKMPQIIFNDKYMDFIYMQDLLTIVNYYINNNNLPKIIDCVYTTKFTLSDISNIINKLNDYRVDIQIENKHIDTPYIGNGDTLNNLKLNLVGLTQGIKNTYNILNVNSSII